MDDFDKIYELYGNQVYKFLICLTNDADLSEELTQETFYQAIKSINKFKGECKLSVWLCQIAKYSYYRYVKKYMHNENSFEEVPEITSEDEIPETIAINKEGTSFLLNCISLLPEQYKNVVYLRAYKDLSFKEIGRAYKNNEIWARVTFYRGKLKLKKIIIDMRGRNNSEDKL